MTRHFTDALSHYISAKILAFTMQFSRYGRNKGSLGASAPREPRPFESAPWKAAASSGPNSVLGSLSFRKPSFRESTEEESVLTGQR